MQRAARAEAVPCDRDAPHCHNRSCG
jgi:hypothetical protein